MIDQETFDTDGKARMTLLRKILTVAERYVFDSMVDGGVDPYDTDIYLATEIKDTMIRLLDSWYGIQWEGDEFLRIDSGRGRRAGDVITVSTRLSQSEYRSLLSQATESGMTPGAMIRMLILARINKVDNIPPIV